METSAKPKLGNVIVAGLALKRFTPRGAIELAARRAAAKSANENLVDKPVAPAKPRPLSTPGWTLEQMKQFAKADVDAIRL